MFYSRPSMHQYQKSVEVSKTTIENEQRTRHIELSTIQTDLGSYQKLKIKPKVKELFDEEILVFIDSILTLIYSQKDTSPDLAKQLNTLLLKHLYEVSNEPNIPEDLYKRVRNILSNFD